MALPGIGVFGTGQSTLTIVPYLKKEGFSVEAIWGKTTEEAESVAQMLDIPFSTSRIDDVLLRKDVDLILVLCPPSHHSQIAVKALGIGKHVAVPPPAGISQNETLRMVQAAQYYPSLISIAVYGLRFLPAFVQAKAILSQPAENSCIGQITLCDVRINSPNLIGSNETYSWACDDHMGGGILNQFGSHVIDILQYLTNFRAVRVHGTLRTFTKTTAKINGIRQISSDDLAVFQMECVRDDGSSNKDNWSNKQEMFVTATLNGCSHHTEFNQEILICGTKGNIILRNQDLYFRKNQSESEETLYLENTSEVISQNNNHMSSFDFNSTPEMFPKGASLLFRHLSSTLKTASRTNTEETEIEGNFKQHSDVSSLASFEDGLYVQAVMEAIRQSSKEKSWSKVSINHW